MRFNSVINEQSYLSHIAAGNERWPIKYFVSSHRRSIFRPTQLLQAASVFVLDSLKSLFGAAYLYRTLVLSFGRYRIRLLRARRFRPFLTGIQEISKQYSGPIGVAMIPYHSFAPLISYAPFSGLDRQLSYLLI